ncbi:MAG: class II SORL domain-containing protein [Prevotellaceae bacterium]|jgi:superoxide reductase|nr:class II SORL domain-containing protein [Prevotellaceae bacterium]
MPLVIKPHDLSKENEKRRAYFDKHTPVITCKKKAKRKQKFKVNVRVGVNLAHPNTKEHYYTYIQLWNLETMLAQANFPMGTFGSEPMQAEVDFYIVPKLSQRLVAMAYCTKHGLWQSEEVFVQIED